MVERQEYGVAEIVQEDSALKHKNPAFVLVSACAIS